MSDVRNESQGDRGLTVRWKIADYELLEEAARVLGQREHLSITTTDIIRSGALRRAEEILSQPADAPQVA
jgi:uncharacterized protein (DUF1778 family)